MDWEQIARTVAPTVAAGLFGPLGGIVANIVGGFLLPDAAAQGKATPQNIANRIATMTDPKDLDKLRQAEAELKKFEADNAFRFAQLDQAGLDSARTMRVGSLASGNRTADRLAWLAIVSFLTVASLTILMVALLISGVFNIASNENAWLAVSGLIGSLLGYFSANANQVIGFYFGSSSGSAAKSDQLAHQATQALTALTRVPQPGVTPPSSPQDGAPQDTPPPGDTQTKVEVERTSKATLTQITPSATGSPAGTVMDLLPAAAAQPAAPLASIAEQPDAAERFGRALDFVFREEGGFSNIPEDHGGATKFGITIGDLQRHRGHPVTIDDVRALTQDEARSIYKSEYWDRVSGDFLPEALDLCAFDGGVLCGPGTGVKLLQRAMGFTGRPVDGIAGHDTIAAAQHGPQARIVQAYAAARRDFHRQTVAKEPNQAKFLQGWLNRVDALEQAALARVR